MSALLVGYARCSTDAQDLTAQDDALLSLGVEAERIYVDHGLTGTNRERPGLREALAARGERELAERVLARAPDQVARADLNSKGKSHSSPPATGSSRSP